MPFKSLLMAAGGTLALTLGRARLLALAKTTGWLILKALVIRGQPTTKEKESTMSPTEQKGVEALTNLVDLPVDLIKLGQAVAADGQVDLQDLATVLSKTPALISAAGKVVSSRGEILPELKDLSAEEASALVTHAMDRLDITNEKAKIVVEHALRIAVSTVAIVKALT